MLCFNQGNSSLNGKIFNCELKDVWVQISWIAILKNEKYKIKNYKKKY